MKRELSPPIVYSFFMRSYRLFTRRPFFFQLSFFISLSDDVELNVKKKFYLHSYSFLGVNKTLIYHHQEEREDDLIFVLLSSM